MISLLNLLICCMKASKVYVLPEEGTPPIALKAACMAINSTELLYIFGGHEKSDKTHNEIYIYNLSETFWTESNPIEQTFPTARYNPGCFIYKESFYVFAGNTNFGPLNDLWAYHAEEMHWEQVLGICLDSQNMSLMEVNTSRFMGVGKIKDSVMVFMCKINVGLISKP